MPRRNQLLSLLLLFSTISVLFAPASLAPASQPPVANAVTAVDHNLSVVWMRGPSDPDVFMTQVENFSKAFEAQHPDTTVQVTFIDWSNGREALLEMVEEGNPPDIALIGARWVPEFVSLGLIEPLDRYITRDFRQLFVPSIINQGAVYLGRTFGLPVATSTRAMYYNLDIFEAAGIEEPPETWDELMEAGKAINALDEDFYGFGLQGGDGLETNTYFYYFVWGNGGDLYNPSRTASALNEDTAIEALEFIKQLIDEGATQPNPASDEYNRRRALEDMFAEGQLGMMISGPWFINRLRTDASDIRFGIAPIPYNTTPATYGVIDTLVMLSTSPHKDVAWEFMEFLYQEKYRLAYAQVVGVLPELNAVANNPVLTNDPDFAVFLSLLPDARFEPLHILSEDISQTVIEAIRSVYLGEAEAEDALNKAAGTINELLGTSSVSW